MSDDDLRLRTAKALGWVLVDSLEWQHLDLGPVRTERYARGDQVAILYRQVNGDQVETTLPLYGTSWASCEEIDAECKKRGWEWEVYVSPHRAAVTVWKPNPDQTTEFTRVVAGGGGAPLFPAAFAEAFCQAVENV